MPPIFSVQALTASNCNTTTEGDTLDALLWRDAEIGPAGVGSALAANPGMAALGAIIPVGTKVTVPTTPTKQSQTRKLVQLWD